VGEPGRPLVLVHGGLAANDAAGTRACLHLAQRLAAGDGAEALARVAYVLIPAPNPDALDDFLLGMPRAGGGALDRDLDGRTGEDGPDDVNGDGAVTRMRRRSPRGTWALASEVELKDTPASPRRRSPPDRRAPTRAGARAPPPTAPAAACRARSSRTRSRWCAARHARRPARGPRGAPPPRRSSRTSSPPAPRTEPDRRRRAAPPPAGGATRDGAIGGSGACGGRA
jgi:hypothetical protein